MLYGYNHNTIVMRNVTYHKKIFKLLFETGEVLDSFLFLN